MALSLGAEGIEYLEPHQFQAFVSYRFLEADRGYIGTHEDPTYKRTIGAQIEVHSFDLNFTYALTRRFSVSLTAPFSSGAVSSFAGHSDGRHHTTRAGGLGDIRAVVNAWLFEPDESDKGNLAFSLGVKAPTGEDEAIDTFTRVGGNERHPVDIAIQPGDGGWGIVVEAQGFRQLFPKTFAYAAGAYLANPREENHTETQVPVFGAIRRNSVPDQYLARAGLSYAVWAHQGLAMSVGGRIDGIPPYDLIGDSDGWRRPGYSVYVEPGLILSRGKNTFSVHVPVAVEINRQKNSLDKHFGTHGPGAFADYLILASISRRF